MSESDKGAHANLRQKAQKHFTSTEQRDANLRHELENERALFDAKSARLRALRLEKQAAESRDSAASETASGIRKSRARRMKRITL